MDLRALAILSDSIVVILATTLSLNGTISSNGLNGADGNQGACGGVGCGMGGGGGGAGGAVRLVSTNSTLGVNSGVLPALDFKL